MTVRKLKPGLLVFAVALLASLSVHLPVYEVLGELAEVLLATPPESSGPQTVEFELAELSDAELEARAEDESRDDPPDESDPNAILEDLPEAEPEDAREQPQAPPPEPKVAAKPPRPQPRVTVVPKEPEPPRPKVEEQNKLAVTQKSDDPDVEPPPDADFIAEDNRRVLEETVARARNMLVDEEPEASQGAESDESATEAGNSDDTEVADTKDVDGSEDRTARPEEVEQAVEKHTPSRGVAAGATEPSHRSQEAQAEVKPQVAAGAPKTGGEPEALVINDGHGTFVVRRAVRGKGPGAGGSEQPRGERSRHRDARRASRGRQGVDLRVSWSQFEQTFGEEKLARERNAQVAQRRSTQRGNSRSRRWKRFKSAIENFVPNVQPGNQTALNAVASPFAAYLARIHRRIHREYAMGFIPNLPSGGGAFDDMTLRTKLEIIINRDGTLHEVGIVETSGFMPFDFGAFDSVMRAGPFSAPPRKILSGDGRVYIHWAFYRNQRQCGTFNASPFKLKGPAEMPGGLPDDPTRDRLIEDPPDSEMGLWRLPAQGPLELRGHEHRHEHASGHDHHVGHDGHRPGQAPRLRAAAPGQPER